MKQFSGLLLLFVTLLFTACSKDDNTDNNTSLSGNQSPMGAVGVTVSSASVEIAGVKNFSAMVTSLKDGISYYSASATITNSIFKNMVTNFPGVTVTGDQVSITNMGIQQTTDGIRSVTGNTAGIIVKYDASVGDTYPIGSTGLVRTVVSKSSTDDYYYGGMFIKTIQVDMPSVSLKSSSISKCTFIANHKYGLVGAKVTFGDGSVASFPVYSSTTN